MNQVFSTERHGYSPEEVDSYINELQSLIDQRNREIMDYKSKEAEVAFMRVKAQQQADAILLQAHKDADEILLDARTYAANIRSEAVQNLDDIAARTRALKDKLDQFKAAYEQIIQQYLIATRATELSALYADLDSFMESIGLRKEEEVVSITDIAAWNKNK